MSEKYDVVRSGESLWVNSKEHELGFVIDEQHRKGLSPYVAVWNKDHKDGPLLALSVENDEVLVQLPGDNFPATARSYHLVDFLNAVDVNRLEKNGKQKDGHCCHCCHCHDLL